MLSRLRTPWFAALLLLASPAFGGQVMPVLHPCPAEGSGHHHQPDTPQVGHGHHDGGAESATADPAASCTCIGSCSPSASLEPPVAGPLLAADVLAGQSPAVVGPQTASVCCLLPLDLLPPATAPPHA